MLNSSKRFLLIRHRESIWNKDSKFTGWTNIPLTNNGRIEASTIGNTLKKNNLVPTIIFSSVLNRAIDTSNIIKKELNNKELEIHTTWRLNEFITENKVDYEWIGMNGTPTGMSGYCHENVALIIHSIN
jgi:2,3-bisphosphoglycerate-dependent phosphoglycerate mutase